MSHSIIKLKVFSISLGILTISTLISCNNAKQEQKVVNQSKASGAQQVSGVQMFINYIDEIAKLPLTDFDQGHLMALNQQAATPMQLIVFAEGQADETNTIIMQAYRNNDVPNPIKAGAIFLLPRSLSDSIQVADFTGRFGELKKEDAAIAVTEQPLPVNLKVDEATTLKLTINHSKQLSQANVITVEVLKYK